MTKKCGYVALLGRPNAGKSTLLNACLGAKISVVSAKPQTTRNRIVGISTAESTQVLFLDTPGIHKAEKLPRINKAMNKLAWSVLGDADIVCYLVDATTGWHEEDAFYLKGVLDKCDKKILLLATKADKEKLPVIFKGMDTMRAGLEEIFATAPDTAALAAMRARFVDPVPCEMSAKRPESVKEFRARVAGFMPVAEWLYPEDDLTDKPQQFICGEIIREQLFRQMGEELPYSCGVKIEKFTEEPTITKILATIIVQRDTHKGMIIGKAGARIKAIGQAARETLEKHLDGKVYLELFVRVQEGWLDDASLIAEYAGIVEPPK